MKLTFRVGGFVSYLDGFGVGCNKSKSTILSLRVVKTRIMNRHKSVDICWNRGSVFVDYDG